MSLLNVDTVNNTAPASKGSNNLSKVIILIIVLIVLGAIVYLVKGADMFGSSKKTVLNAIDTLQKAETVHSIVTIDAQIPSYSAGTSDFKLKFEADAEKKDISNPSLSGTFTVSGSGMSASANMIIKNKDIFFKITDLPALIKNNSTGVAFFDKWFSITQKDLEGMASLYGQSSSTLAMIKNDSSLYNVDFINKLISKYNIISNVKSIGKSTENGETVKKYNIVLNKDEVFALYKELIDLRMNSYKTEQNLSEDVKVKMDEITKNVFSAIKFSDLVVSIGDSDSMIRSIKASLSIDMNTITGYGAYNDTSKDTTAREIKLDLQADYSNINKPVNIVAPENAESIMNMINKSLGEARLKAKDAAIKAQLSSMRAVSEIYYDKGQTYTGVCSKDKNAIEISKSMSGSGTKLMCNVSSESYSMYAKLADGTYYCVDSTGQFKTLKSAPTSTVCK